MNGLLVRTRFRRVDGSYFSPPHGNSLPEDPLHLDCFLVSSIGATKRDRKGGFFPQVCLKGNGNQTLKNTIYQHETPSTQDLCPQKFNSEPQ